MFNIFLKKKDYYPRTVNLAKKCSRERENETCFNTYKQSQGTPPGRKKSFMGAKRKMIQHKNL